MTIHSITLPKELNPEACLSKKQVREFLGGIGSSTVNLWIKTRGFPHPIDFSKTFPLWRVKDVIAWLDSQQVRNQTGAKQP